MQHILRMQMGGGSDLASSSDDAHIVVALRKLMKKDIEMMVIHTVQQVIGPIVEDLIHRVVKVEIQSALEKFSTGLDRKHADQITMSTERMLYLKFLDEVSSSALTGKEIKGKEDNPIRVALVDETTGDVVRNGPEASAKVEILVLDASSNDNEDNWSLEEFNSRIIRDNDKKKPHFTKTKYIYLKEGTSTLSNVKLGHDSSWTKSCECRLGARILGNFPGVKVKEALTGSFVVKDSRGNLYEKSNQPLLTDELWRLENIGKDGPPCKRLNKENILTVQDFLFLHRIDPQRLEKIAGVHGKKWKATVSHAQTCNIDDKKFCLYFPVSHEYGVVFDVVGGLKGIIRDFHYVPVDSLPEAEKACQQKLLLSAFENRKELTSFDDEASLLLQFPCPPTGNVFTNDPILGSDPCGYDPIAQSTSAHDPTEVGSSYQSIDSSVSQSGHFNDISHFGSLDELSFADPYQLQSCLFSDLDPHFENFGDNESLMAIMNNLSETLTAEAHSCQQSKARSINWVRLRAVAAMLLVCRARRVTCQEDDHVSKKQKIG